MDDRRCPECGGDLGSDAAPEGFCPQCLLELALVDPAAAAGTTACVAGETGPPERIGPYRIVQKVGEGGMGEVYLAAQEQPLRRKVALKLIKTGMDTRQVVARFESERQALALMSHPNIARVFDAGATVQGRPYFVMEFVEGVPITEYCDTQRLTTRQRLELFRQVCDGVQHAHHKGIIHRDIKPSNVLVAVQDGQPSPKIIDFGVAKATEQRLIERSAFTQMGMLVGTPEYMSPEQASLTALDVDTRTDVYSLGVLLYELLAGALPFDSGELRRAAFDEVCRRIREEEPSKPSTRILALGRSSTASAERRRTDPSSLVRELRGDLDWITMKALDKDRARRYASPGELAADVVRHLHHEPVVAGPPGARYRARKFVRRHRAGVSFGAALLVVLIGFAVSMAIQAARIARERDRANREAATAERVSTFLVDLFEVADPGEARGNTITAREVLDTGAQRIDAELEDQPAVKARLLRTIGLVYRNLGLYDQAEPLLEDALDRERGLRGQSDPRTLGSMMDLAWLQVLDGRLDEGASTYASVLETARTELGEEHPTTWRAQSMLANVYRLLDRGDEAVPMFRQALEAQQRTLGAEHKETQSTRVNLAALYQNLGRYDEAEPLLIEALEIDRRTLGEDHPDVLTTMSQLARLYRLQGRYDDAEPLFVRTLELRRRVLGDEHLQTRRSMRALAFMYVTTGRYDDAESLAVEAHDLNLRTLGKEHRQTLGAANSLANLYRLQGRTEESEGLFRETLDAQRRLFGVDDWSTRSTMVNLAALYKETRRHEEAESLLLEALAADRRIAGEDHPDTLITASELAGLYRLQGRYDEAEELVRATLGARRRVLGQAHPSTLASRHQLARILAAKGETAEALDLLRQAVEGGFDAWGRPERVLDQWSSFDGNPEYESIVAGLRRRVERPDR